MTQERIVIDASVAIALVHDEPGSRKIGEVVAEWLRRDLELVAPSHFWLEVINPLARRHGYDGRRLLEALRDLDGLPITTIETDRPQLVLAIGLMEQLGMTAYDAAYVALARTISARLASTDAMILGAAGALGVDPRLGPDRGPGHRVAEERAPYGEAVRPVTWPTWPGAGSYLASLRRRAIAGG